MKCDYCGKTLSLDSTKCLSCGAPKTIHTEISTGISTYGYKRKVSLFGVVASISPIIGIIIGSIGVVMFCSTTYCTTDGTLNLGLGKAIVIAFVPFLIGVMITIAYVFKDDF